MGSLADQFRTALASRVLLLDGATGTELTRRGVPTPLPLWSAGALIEHPDVLAAIHGDYVEAGADIIVANTFRTNVRTLRAAGMLEQGERLNRTAVELARKSTAGGAGARQDDVWNRLPAGESPAGSSAEHRLEAGATPFPLIAASVSPVEDCYHPERAPDEATLIDEHTHMMQWLEAAGADLIWIETMNTVREAGAAATAAWARAMPFVVSFVVREDGDLLSGEPLEEGVAAVEAFDPLAIGLNCIPPEGVTRTLPRLRAATGRPLVAYAHIGNPEPINGWSFSQDVSPVEYAEQALGWVELGARIVGGCCGTTPEHIRALRAAIGE